MGKPTKKKVLVIEDEQKLAESVKNFLVLKGYTVTVSTSGKEGLELVKKINPDVVVTDIIMPQMDGYSMVKEIRKERRGIPIIVMTAKDKMKELFAIEGIDAFLSKPFDLQVLEDKIKAGEPSEPHQIWLLFCGFL